MKKILFIYFLSITIISYAQKGTEVKTALKGNFELSQYAKLHPDKIDKKLFNNHILGKMGYADSSFPFIERFTNLGNAVSNARWQDDKVSKIGQSCVFDSYDKSGNVYPGKNFGPADTLTSQPISINLVSSSNIYLEFNYSGGSVWTPGDSLVLLVLNDSGNWITLWSTKTFEVNKTVFMLIDPTALSLNSSNIVFRYINYTNLFAGYTEDFILYNFIFAQKLNVPYYENMSTFSHDSFPSKQYWSQAKTNITYGSQFGLTWCNPAVFDAYDENQNVYNNSVGSGYADTLMSHYLDLSGYQLSDSVFLRFYCRAMPSSTTPDSLILQFRDNTGLWVNVKTIEGTPFNDFRAFYQYINLLKFRGSLFQFRLINKCKYISSSTLKWIVSGFNIGKRISLPIIDDFSTSKIYPNKDLWKDKLVYINNNFPINPPSFNVATFDGLDSKGNPYCNNCFPLSHSYCDSLTSWPINLSKYSAADSIYLSFYIEPQGLGEMPNSSDSFIVEMRNTPYDQNSFVPVWGDIASNYSYNQFTQILVRVDSSYLHDDFQFRFKNIGSLTGNTDHWNLDYIKIDNGRNKFDTLPTGFSDDAISMTPVSLLKPYSSMPWKHYIVNPTIFDVDTQYYTIKNNSNTSHNDNYYRNIYNQQSSLIDSSGNILNFFGAGKFSDVFVSRTNPLVATNPSLDTISFSCKYSVKQGTSTDNIPSNDTLIKQQIFSNYYAYDDGSAEAGYDIANYPGSVALGYALNGIPDTLYGIALFFNQSAFNVTDRPFDFMVWKNVALPPAQSKETIMSDVVGNPCIYPFSGPVYQNQINGFYYYQFHDPVAVSDTFYIGWQQSTVFELNVGLDQNFQINGVYGANPMMYYKTLDISQWQQTQLTGALMMRPIVGKWLNPPLAVNNIQHQQNDVLIYPNPAKDYITIQLSKIGLLDIELMDMAGRLILSEKIENKLSLPSLQTGMYLLKITDTEQHSIVKKIIIQQ